MRRPLLLAALLLAPALPAQQPRRMTFDDVMAMRNVADAQLSPDGKWVAYVVSRIDMKENATDADVWLVSATGGEPVRLTTSRKSDATPRWSPDGKRLAFISAREERPQLFVISPFGGEAERLTESKTAVRSFQWSPDGRSIAFVADQEPTPEEEKRQKDRDDAIVVDRDFRFARLWILDVDGRSKRMLATGEGVVSDPQWSPDGKRLAYVSTATPRADDGQLTDVFVIETDSGATPRKLVTNPGPDNSPRWSPDGSTIALQQGDSGKVRQDRLTVVSAEGGTPRPVANGFTYNVAQVAWSPDGRSLLFSAPTRTTTQLYVVPAAGGTPRALTNLQGTWNGLSWSKDGRTMAAAVATLNAPADVHVASLPQGNGTATFRKRTDHNAQLKGIALARSEVITWKSADGKEIEGVLLYPTDHVEGRKVPLLTVVHGGPAGQYNQSFYASYQNYGHVWAGEGWAVFYPNFRGSSGYGEEFLRANMKDWGGGDYKDIQSGIDHLVQRGLADPAKLAQTGWSYGGYMTAWTVTQTTRFKAAMVGAGLTDMYSMHSTNDLPGTVEAYFGGEPWDVEQLYRERSAMTHVKKAKTPTLILHGQQDLRVPIGQAQQLYQGLKRNEVPVELVFYPREGHGLSEPRHQLDKMKREHEWITKHTLGAGTATP